MHLRPRLLGLDCGVRGLRESLEGDRLVPGTAAVEFPPAAVGAAAPAAAVDATDCAEAREDEDGGERDHNVQPAALDVTEIVHE